MIIQGNRPLSEPPKFEYNHYDYVINMRLDETVTVRFSAFHLDILLKQLQKIELQIEQDREDRKFDEEMA
jgi:hypothetical protein